MGRVRWRWDVWYTGLRDTREGCSEIAEEEKEGDEGRGPTTEATSKSLSITLVGRDCNCINVFVHFTAVITIVMPFCWERNASSACQSQGPKMTHTSQQRLRLCRFLQCWGSRNVHMDVRLTVRRMDFRSFCRHV
jgi:hypothetical protein